ncbi:MAG: TonB-dependent siderophore receptor [Cellvibrio sp.]|uniref:TonB-dependent siderophore receptor n=1 Tax=Cellvibrio sp. TaxID=1965322 RepID=UPI0031B0874D
MPYFSLTPLARVLRATVVGTGIVVGLTSGSVAVAQVAQLQAQAVQQIYHIPAGSLAQSLNRFASEAGITLSFTPDLVEGKQAPEISGSFTPQEGLKKILQGSGLETVIKSDGSFSLKRAPQPPSGKLSAVKVSSTALTDATEGSGSYTVPVVSVGGKLGETLRETPRSISVITRQQLDDQRIQNFYDAVNQLPGITMTYGSGNSNEASFYSRGHSLTNITADGMAISVPSLDDSRGGGSNNGMAKYDNVQLLRGPDSLFSGNGQPAGTINLVRKRPLENFQAKTAVTAGSWDNYSGEVDVSSPITSDGRVRGRAVLANNTGDHFYASGGSHKSTAYGVVDFAAGEKTVIVLGGSIDTQHGAPDQPPGLPRYFSGAQLDIHRSVGYADWVQRSYDLENIFATVEHQFNDQWKLKTGVSRTATNNGRNVVTMYDGMVDPVTLIGDGVVYTTRADWNADVETADISLIGTTNLFNREQKFAFGADYADVRQYSLISYHNNPLPVPDWNDFNPDEFLYPSSMAKGWDNQSKQKQQGAYAYGYFQIQGALKFVLGGRYASYELYSTGFNAYRDANGDCASWATTCESPISIKSNDNSGIFTPYYGLLYDISNRWTAYLTHSESFEDQSTFYTPEHDMLDPTEGKSWELGIKGEHVDGRLNTNITFYRTDRENYRVNVSNDISFNMPGKNCCYRGDGEFLAQGVELDISGALTDNWQINAGYTYDDNKEEYGANDGKRYSSNTPKHILRLWSSYQFTGALDKLRVGGGVQAQSSFYQSGTVNAWNPTGGLDGKGAFDGPAVPYDFTEAGRALWNTFAEYRLDSHWSLALNVNNLFDKEYYQVAGTTSGDNTYGMPRSWSFTVRGKF